MPATAGRTKMPAGNRMDTGSALRTNNMWSSVIGHDPYAGGEEQPGGEGGATGPSGFDAFRGLLAQARLTGGASAEARGTCRRCNGSGHLTFQCRNMPAEDAEAAAGGAAGVAAAAAAAAAMGGKRPAGSSSSLDSDLLSSDSSDSDSDDSERRERKKRRKSEKKEKKEKQKHKRKKEKKEKKDKKDKKEKKERRKRHRDD